MQHQATTKDDLAYVANVVRKANFDRGVPAIYVLWAVITLIGFSLPDIRPQMTGLFWGIAGPVGGLLSFALGHRASRREGATNQALAARYGWHWGLAAIAFFLAMLPAINGMPIAWLSSNFLLIAALVYGLAATHLDRMLVVPAAILAIGYVVLVLVAPPYTWTATGILMCVSLLIAAVRSRADA